MNINEDIKNAIENYISEQDKNEMNSFWEYYGELSESHKSQIVKILLGKKIIKKDASGKISHGDPAEVKKALSDIGIKS
jgi:hypothetical protein